MEALERGDYDGAVAAFEASAEQGAAGTFPLYHLGVAELCRGNAAQAKRAFERSFFEEGLGGRADLLRARDRQLELDPPSCHDVPRISPLSRPKPRRTVDVERTDRTESATEPAEDIPDDDELIGAELEAARAGIAGGDLETALESLGQALELEPSPERKRDIEDTFVTLVESAVSRADLRTTDRAIDRFAAQFPESEELASLREAARDAARGKARSGLVKRMRGDYDGAIRELRDALLVLEDRPSVHLYLAWLYFVKYLADGSTESETELLARESIRDALRLDHASRADPRIVSPEFIDLVTEIRSETQK